MPLVTVEWLAGRPAKQKSELAAALTDAFASIAGVPKDQIWIIFRDTSRSDWAMGGKLLEPPKGS